MKAFDSSSVTQPEGVPLSDADLVELLQRGDESALASLYDRYSKVVYSVALRTLGDTGMAEDVLQEIFMQLWRKPASFDSGRGTLGPWLAVLARNRAIDQLRKRRPEDDVNELQVDCGLDLESESLQKLIATKARTEMGKMPPEQRRALELSFFEGMTHAEIAAKTGEPLGTIKTRIRNGLLAIRRALQ